MHAEFRLLLVICVSNKVADSRAMLRKICHEIGLLPLEGLWVRFSSVRIRNPGEAEFSHM
jgi:hypothetical protein